VAETIYQVIINQAGGLQVGINDSRPKELESFLLHIPGYAI
jgi:hypothetical protein